MQAEQDGQGQYTDILNSYFKTLNEPLKKRAESVEAAKLPESDSPLFTQMPSGQDLLASGVNPIMQMYADELRRQSELSPEEQSTEMALGSLPIAGVNRYGVKTGGRWFHGTPNATNVAKEGFKTAKSGSQNSTSLGEGIYFSNYPQTANRYARDQHGLNPPAVFPSKYSEKGIRPSSTPVGKEHKKLINDLIDNASPDRLENFGETTEQAKKIARATYRNEPKLLDLVTGMMKDLYNKEDYTKAIEVLRKHNITGFEEKFKDGERYRAIIDDSMIEPAFGNKFDKNRK